MSKFETTTSPADRLADFYHDLGSLLREVHDLRYEVGELREYRQKYIDLLNDSTAHNQHMVGGLLALALKPGVLDAIAKSNEDQP